MFKIILTSFRFLNFLKRGLLFKFLMIALLITFGAFMELITLGSLIPVLTTLIPVNTNMNISSLGLSQYLEFFKLNTFNLLILFLVFYSISFLTRSFILYTNINFSHLIGNLIIRRLTDRLNSDDVIQGRKDLRERLVSSFLVKTDLITAQIFYGIVQLISGAMVAIFIIIFLLLLDFWLAFSIIFFVLIFYYLVILLVKNIAGNHAKYLEKFLSSFVKNVTEGLDSLRELLIFKSFNLHFDNVIEEDRKIRRAKVLNQFLAGVPRISLEFFIVLLFILYIIVNINDISVISNKIPIIAAFVFSAQRLIPSAQQIYSSIISIKFGSEVLNEIYDIIVTKNNKIIINDNITLIDDHNEDKPIKEKNTNLILNNIDFNYEKNDPLIFEGLNYEFKKGKVVGVTGASGSGKSTLINIILGFNIPLKGIVKLGLNTLSLNNRYSWFENVSFVSQNIFLFNDTIENNITLRDRSSLSKNRLKQSIEGSCLNDKFLTKELSLNYKIGQTGHKLSGGQRQRLGIARGLYKKADIYIFDEATSALDYKLKFEVFKNIQKICRNDIVIFVSHDLELLDLCDEIINVQQLK